MAQLNYDSRPFASGQICFSSLVQGEEEAAMFVPPKNVGIFWGQQSSRLQSRPVETVEAVVVDRRRWRSG